MVRKFAVFVLLAMFTMLGSSLAWAEGQPLTPDDLKGAMVVNDEWVKDNYKKMKVYDVRKKAEYAEGHIPGAVAVPYDEKSDKSTSFDPTQDKFNLSVFPSDKNEPLIIYCNGPRCWKSYKAAILLIKAGHKNVHWYRNDGFPAWKSKGNPVE